MISLGFVFKIEENVYLNFKTLRTFKSQISLILIIRKHFQMNKALLKIDICYKTIAEQYTVSLMLLCSFANN